MIKQELIIYRKNGSVESLWYDGDDEYPQAKFNSIKHSMTVNGPEQTRIAIALYQVTIDDETYDKLYIERLDKFILPIVKPKHVYND